MTVALATSVAEPLRLERPDAPYPGLRPFQKREWAIFFGRERMIDNVIDRLIDRRLAVVHGDSGCGKSSLIRAGVLAKLELEHSRSGLIWRTEATRPTEGPIDGLAQALARVEPKPSRDLLEQIHSALMLGRDAAAELADLLQPDRRTNICVLIDQFEELFTFAKAHRPEEAQLLTEILLGLQKRRRPGLYAILTMRSEFLGHCARFEGFAETVNRTQYLLPRMEHPALMRAIREPARLYNGQVSLDLADRLIADACGGQDQLPLIQHGLMLLWQRKVGQPSTKSGDTAEGSGLGEAPGLYHQKPAPAWTLDLSDYRGSGGLAQLLSDHADQVMHEVAPDEPRQKVVEHMFRALTDINAEGHAIRRPQTVAQLQAVTGAAPAILDTIVGGFRAEGVSFLSPYGDAPLERDQQVDISHEALIRCWQRIADKEEGWLQREFRDGLTWQSLRMQADKFATNKEETLSPASTMDRDAWLTTLPSKAWCQRYRGGWEGVQRLMQASRAARARQERKDSLVQWGLIAASAIFLLLTAFAGWNWWQAREALAQRIAAEEEVKAAHKKALFGDSLFRAAQARGERENGSAVNAMLLALAGLPEKLGEADARSWVGETAGALVEAFGVARERLVLRGPDADVLAAAFSPDGAQIVSGGADGTVRVWNAASGKLLRALKAHDGLIKAVAYSPDGDRIVSGSEDKTVRVWDAASSEKPSLTLLGHEGWVNTTAFSTDGGRIVSGSADGTVRVWDAANGEQLQDLNGHHGEVLAAAFSLDGAHIVSGYKDGTVRVWDLASGKQLRRLEGHQGGVNAVAFSPDGGRIVSGSADDTVRVWDAASESEPLVLSGHEGDVLAAAFSRDGARIVSGAEDRTVRVWDLVTGLVLVLRGHERWVTGVEFSPNGSQVLSASADNTVRTWDVGTLQDLVVLQGHEGDVLAAAFSPDGARIVSGSADSTARVWSAALGRDFGRYGYLGNVLAVAFSPAGGRIVGASADGQVRVWDPAGGEEPTLVLPRSESSVNDVAFSPDGGRIITGSADGAVRVWDASSRQQLLVLEGHEADVLAAAFSPDGAHIASGSKDKTVRIWDAASGAKLLVLPGHEKAVNAVAFSPDGARIVSGSADGTVRVWDAESGQQLQVLNRHDGDVLAAAFSPDGARIVSGAEDRTVRVWDATSAGAFSETLVLRGHEGAVFAAAFSPDGARIVSGSGDNTIRVTWIGRNKQELMKTARARLPRELSEEERRRFYLAIE
jgi:WD40 repeat protein